MQRKKKGIFISSFTDQKKQTLLYLAVFGASGSGGFYVTCMRCNPYDAGILETFESVRILEMDKSSLLFPDINKVFIRIKQEIINGVNFKCNKQETISGVENSARLKHLLLLERIDQHLSAAISCEFHCMEN